MNDAEPVVIEAPVDGVADPRARRVALLVAGPGRPDDPRPLNTERDVAALAAALLDPAGGGFSRVTILAEPAALREALSSLIKDEKLPGALRAAISRAAPSIVSAGAPTTARTLDATRTLGGGASNTALVYLSGHGRVGPPAWKNHVATRYFLTTPMDTGAGTLELRVYQLEAALARVPARQHVLIDASCFSGAEGAKAEAPPMLLDLSSGIESELGAAVSIAIDDPIVGFDRYTWYLLQAIYEHRPEADGNGDGALSDVEANAYIRARLREHPGRQEPVVRHAVGVGVDDVILAGQPHAPSRVAFYAQGDRAEEWQLAFAPAGTPKGAPVPLSDGARWTEPGRYDVSLWSERGERLYEGPVRLDRSVELERLTDRTEPLALSVGVGAYTSFDADLADQVVGRGGALRLRASAPLGRASPVGWIVEGSLSATYGLGQEATFDAVHPTVWTGGLGTASLLRLQRLRMADFAFGVSAGVLSGVHRDAWVAGAVPVRSAVFWGPVGGARARFELTPGTRWTYGVGADLLFTAFRLDDLVAPRPLLLGSLDVGYRW